MKNQLLILITLFMTIFSNNMVNAQWTLVWQDEFNESISSDWTFETGMGDWGWGNNELQYYRQENATIVNGMLQIQARAENYGGAGYTSARLKTQGHKSFKYGKVEARISMPSFNGVWPAFWMLGDNISSVGWPACGEIDIMEHINTENKVYGTIHWDHNGHASYGGNTTASVTGFHIYSIEWDDQYIRWFVDGNQFHEASIAGGINGTEEFHNKFFIILNMAIGGEWPGYTIDNSAMPANMLVDYVRVYQQDGTTGVTNLNGEYFIRNRKSGLYMDVYNSGTEDGSNIIQWGYLGSNNQKFEFIHQGNGIYTIKSVNSGKVLDITGASANAGANLQQWTDYGTTNQRFLVTSAGDGYYQLSATNSDKVVEVADASTNAGANIQQWDNNNQLCSHWSLEPVTQTAWSTTIEAENYVYSSDVAVEDCSEGGQNVGYIDAGDWLVWDVNIPASGTYTVDYRVASLSTGGTFQLEKAGGSLVYNTINVPVTGGWQNWATITHTVNLDAGQQQIAIYTPTGGFNINWLTLTQGLKSTSQINQVTTTDLTNNIEIYPLPAKDFIYMTGLRQKNKIEVFDIQGKVCMQSELSSGFEKLNITSLNPGTYILRITNETGTHILKFLK